MTPTRPPKLDRRITILGADRVTNRLGERRPSNWSAMFDTRAGFAPVSDGERWRAGAIEQKADARFTIRRTAQSAVVSGRHRLQFDGSDWQITGVKLIGRKWLEITAWKLEKPGV